MHSTWVYAQQQSVAGRMRAPWTVRQCRSTFGVFWCAVLAEAATLLILPWVDITEAAQLHAAVCFVILIHSVLLVLLLLLRACACLPPCTAPYLGGPVELSRSRGRPLLMHHQHLCPQLWCSADASSLLHIFPYASMFAIENDCGLAALAVPAMQAAAVAAQAVLTCTCYVVTRVTWYSTTAA